MKVEQTSVVLERAIRVCVHVGIEVDINFSSTSNHNVELVADVATVGWVGILLVL